MPTKNGNRRTASQSCGLALLLIDVINPLDFPEADQLLGFIPAMTRKIRRLKQRAKKAEVPVVYLNDNFGRWHSDFRSQVQYCLSDESLGREMVKQLQPEEKRLFCSKTEALRVLRDPSEYASARDWGAAPHSYRHCWQLLRLT